MTASEFIDPSLQLLPENSTVKQVLEFLATHKITEALLGKDSQSLHIVSLAQLLNQSENLPALTLSQPFTARIASTMHWAEVMRLFQLIPNQLLPVTGANDTLLGLISKSTFYSNISILETLYGEGAILQLTCDDLHYSASEVARIAEMNNTRILALVTGNVAGTRRMQILLKIASYETRSLSASFERFGYVVENEFMNKESSSDLFNDRYESLIRILDL